MWLMPWAAGLNRYEKAEAQRDLLYETLTLRATCPARNLSYCVSCPPHQE